MRPHARRPPARLRARLQRAAQALAPTPLPARVVEVAAAALPLACPPLGDPIQARHPRVYLDVLASGEAQCPYCATRYRLRAGERVDDHRCGGCDLHQHRENPLARVAAPPAGRPSPARSLAGIVDASGRTTLEQMTAWLRGRWSGG